MKRVISTIAVLFILLAFVPFALAGTKAFQVNTASGGTLTTSLISYYNFQSNSNDQFGSNNGSDTGMSYTAGGGKVNNGAVFDGSTSIINVSNIAPQNPFSFAFG